MSKCLNQPVNAGTQCFVNYCKTSYNVEGQEVENKYKCHQQNFTSSDMWRITRSKKAVGIRGSIF